jgi:hypothetical protein
VIVSIDPGRKKCGLALMEMSGRVVERGIVPLEDVPRVVGEWRNSHPDVHRMLMGNGTGHEAVRALFPDDFPLTFDIVPEKNTTLRARARYFKENPPPWYLRWIPVSMRVPPVPVDDWAAVLIADDYLSANFSRQS